MSINRAGNIFPKYLLFNLHEIARKYPREKKYSSSFYDSVCKVQHQAVCENTARGVDTPGTEYEDTARGGYNDAAETECEDTAGAECEDITTAGR